MLDNVYGMVRENEAISIRLNQFFYKSQQPSKSSETRMHYIICYLLGFLF